MGDDLESKVSTDMVREGRAECQAISLLCLVCHEEAGSWSLGSSFKLSV